ncbi:hypothetical protein V6N13_089427 [Hibiscus sabdariffa]
MTLDRNLGNSKKGKSKLGIEKREIVEVDENQVYMDVGSLATLSKGLEECHVGLYVLLGTNEGKARLTTKVGLQESALDHLDRHESVMQGYSCP